MKDELYLILKSKGDTVLLGDVLHRIIRKEDFNLNDYEVSFANTLSQFLYNYQEEVVDFIIDKGFSNFINTKIINESVIAAGTPQSEIISVLTKYLTKVGIDNELIIVDPFFLAPTRIPNYPQFVENILINFISTIDTIKIITTANPGKVDTSLLAQIDTTLKIHKPALQIIHTTTNNFHDRFWISNNREKGIITGTSLNGFGNKIALVDRLNISDVREIVGELLTQGLI